MGTTAAFGYSGLGTRGSVDSMVLTELAWDDLELQRRLQENEVLYYALLASRRPGLQLAIECVALVVVGAGGLALIPHFGVGGAALAAAAGAATRAVLSGYLVLRWQR